ncbi:MAG TPA: Gfo/Idh/MocA family oxidoreductase [bacterium]|nr:Gfo/Idh/MocA family oxidoreductase [bacterium]
MSKKLKWGILSTGRIARTFARDLRESRTGELIAIGSRTQEAAEQFGEEFGVQYRYPTYAGVLENPEVEAVYICPINPPHAEWAIQAAEAKKHILLEKPFTVNAREAEQVIEAARRNDVFLMEAFMYRCHPQTKRLVELIREGAIGQVRIIQATFSFYAELPADSRILEARLGGGGILDVGCYCVSMCRLVAGAAMGRDFAEPIELHALGRLREDGGVDDFTVGIAKFPGDVVAQFSCGVGVEQDNTVRIYGTEGHIFLREPWVPGPEGQPACIHLRKRGEQKGQEIMVPDGRRLYTIEADLVAENIANRQAPPPAMTWEDTLGNMRMLDHWRSEIGLSYDFEK